MGHGEAHCFSDSDTEYDMETHSNSLNDDAAAEGAEGAWKHPYEDMELVTPSAEIELREFPVVDLAREAEAASRRERKINSLSGRAGCGIGGAGADAPRAPGVTRLLGKGSWTINVTSRGGVGKMVHNETPGPDRRAILPCVDRHGTGNVMVAALGGSGWEFSEVGRGDKRAMSVLWPKEKCIGSGKVGPKAVAPRLVDDISEMTPEERLQRERRDEKNRKERERRAQLKLDKIAKREAELAQAAAAAAADAAAPCGPSASSAPTTPAPCTPNEPCDAGTPQTVAKADVHHACMEMDAKHMEIAAARPHNAQPHHAAASTVAAASASRQPPSQVPVGVHTSAPVAAVAANQPTTAAPVALPTTPASVTPPAATSVTAVTSAAPAKAVVAPVPAPSRAPAATPLPGPAVAQPASAPSLAPSSTSSPAPTAAQPAAAQPVAEQREAAKSPVHPTQVHLYAGKKLPAPVPTTTESAVTPSPLMGVTAVAPAIAHVAPAQVPQPSAVASLPSANTVIISAQTPGKEMPAVVDQRVPAAAPVTVDVADVPAASSPVATAKEVVATAPMEVDANHEEADRADKENLHDDDSHTSTMQERGRCDKNDTTTLAKRRRPDLSPVQEANCTDLSSVQEVNCRAAAAAKRAVRPRGVQRA